MMYKPKSLQNAFDWSDTHLMPGYVPPTIVITVDSPEWPEAYQNWRTGKDPTDSPEWKKGVIMTFQKVTPA